ncbi:MAG: hypothetical protein ACRDYA_02995 [Egibacteraceae bacterium]
MSKQSTQVIADAVPAATTLTLDDGFGDALVDVAGGRRLRARGRSPLRVRAP